MYERNPALHDLYHAIGSWLRRLRNRSRARRTAEWVRTDAVIRNARVRQLDQFNAVGKMREWRPIVRYEYQVENTTYSGKASGEIWYFDEDGASDTVESLIGAILPIRYDPSRPSKSFYLPQDGGPPQLRPANPDAKTGLVVLSLKK
ncbi:MAG TPA: DUF3592 domain-containing protein [Candidatus Angelobacter sp.]|jgi:hypothetical protein